MDPMDIYSKNNYLHSFKVDLFPSLFRKLLDLHMILPIVDWYVSFSQLEHLHPRKLTLIPKMAIFERRYMLKTILFGIYLRFRGGVGLLASFDLDNTKHHPAAQCDSCTRQQQHGKAQQRHGFVGYLSQVSRRVITWTGRSTGNKTKHPFVKKDGNGETTTSQVKVWNPWFILSMKSWLFHRDLKNGLCHNPHITG